MIRAALVASGLLLATNAGHAADACQALTTNKQLPMDFKVVSRAKLGPAELVILSNGKCTCNDTPSVQRSIGQAEPEGVFWACEAADADESRGK